MSTATQCKQFVQNAWKKELCSNCFKSKEEHVVAQPATSTAVSSGAMLRSNNLGNSIHNNDSKIKTNSSSNNKTTTIIGSASRTITTTGVKVTAQQRKIQGILRAKESTSSCQQPQQNRAKRKKNVAFPDSLIEIIGYDGGDDFTEDDGTGCEESDFCDSLGSEDDTPDSEEERALGNLTRANTNFNTVTANLSGSSSADGSLDSLGSKASAKTFASLMLGQAQIDADGKKKTLLISVTPFGGADESAQQPIAQPTAKKPTLKKFSDINVKSSPPKSLIEVNKPTSPSKKIIDMPLITSISTASLTEPVKLERKTNIARTPAIKKAENEKPRIAVVNSNSQSSPTATPVPVKLEAKLISSGVFSREVEGEASKEVFRFDESRESVGEPDGKADEELVSEPPALPTSPPPSVQAENAAEPRVSFLHNETKPPSVAVKPVIPPKPTKLLTDQASSEDFKDPTSPNKRRMAPPPPATAEDPMGCPGAPSLFTRNQAPVSNSDCPVVREKEKRERASSCSPKFRQPQISDSPDPYGPSSYQGPETATSADRNSGVGPRKNISLSQDSLSGSVSLGCVDERKKSRSKFSIKKFLRMGTKREVDMTCAALGARIDKLPTTPQNRPRIEIIHPLDLNGAGVQVVRSEKLSEVRIEGTSVGGAAQSSQQQSARPGRPPPPPRNQSLQDDAVAPRLLQTTGKSEPIVPRTSPSRNDKPISKSWQSSSAPSGPDSIYANLAAEDVAGAIRSALAPAKPRRTSSMRDQTTSADNKSSTPVNHMSNGVLVPNKSHLHGSKQHLQQNTDVINSKSAIANLKSESKSSLSNSMEPNSLELRHKRGNYPIVKRQSDSGAMDSNKDLKFQRSFVRSCSLPYCGSEIDSDIHSLYNDEGIECDGDWKSDQEQQKIGGRLRHRRGRSIVHSSLEDNYGAVVVANHEALAQFLEQMSQISSVLPSVLRQLKVANLQLKDFEVDKSASVTVGKKIFYPAIWSDQNVTLCVSFDQSIHVSKDEFHFSPIVDFIDDLPQDIMDQTNYPGRKCSRATISVLPRLQVQAVRTFANSIPEAGDENVERESLFMLLQLVSALKNLQARGIEETSKNLSNIVLCREDKEVFYRLYLLESVSLDSCENNEEKYISLCQCALNALRDFKLTKRLPLIQELLTREKAVALSQVKSILEFSLWGPADATLGAPRERELALQRWLDLERATVLHALVRTRAPLTVTDEYQILFLVRTTAKIMCEASLHLDKQRNGLLRSH